MTETKMKVEWLARTELVETSSTLENYMKLEGLVRTDSETTIGMMKMLELNNLAGSLSFVRDSGGPADPAAAMPESVEPTGLAENNQTEETDKIEDICGAEDVCFPKIEDLSQIQSQEEVTGTQDYPPQDLAPAQPRVEAASSTEIVSSSTSIREISVEDCLKLGYPAVSLEEEVGGRPVIRLEEESLEELDSLEEENRTIQRELFTGLAEPACFLGKCGTVVPTYSTHVPR